MTGTNGTLECSAVGSPPPDYDVTSNADVQTNIVLDAVIEIMSAVPPNTGLYSCSVSNSAGSVSRVYQLNVGSKYMHVHLYIITIGLRLYLLLCQTSHHSIIKCGTFIRKCGSLSLNSRSMTIICLQLRDINIE